MEKFLFYYLFFCQHFLDISSFYGTTDIPVLDVWDCLPWVLKPGWIHLLVCFIACM